VTICAPLEAICTSKMACIELKTNGALLAEGLKSTRSVRIQMKLFAAKSNKQPRVRNLR